jgi:hypothetical protein
MSSRALIIESMVAAMQAITELQTVERCRAVFSQAELPALGIWDTIAEHNLVHGQPTAALQQNALTMQFRVFADGATDAERAENVESLIETVMAKIGEDRFLNDGTGDKNDPDAAGNQVLWIKPVRSGLVVPAETFEVAGGAIDIEIAYFTAPFAV